MQAVLFDFDGTLWDPETSIFRVYSEVFEEFGHSLGRDAWASVVGSIESDLWSRLEHSTGVPVNLVKNRIQQRKAESLASLKSRPGVRRLLDDVDAMGIPRGIVSNSASDWVERYSRQCGVADGWSTVQCANGDLQRAKPNPHLYSEAVERLGVDPRAVIAFEDSRTGLQAAKRARIRCVVVPNAMTANLDLSEADLRLESFEEVSPGRLLQPFESV
jgi:HAD superfamily hydrolase (TIGR01509 family)